MVRSASSSCSSSSRTCASARSARTARKYMPIIFTFWLMIFFGNFVALFFPTAPTADLGFNLGMALLISIGYVEYEGIRANGLFGHLSHFAGPKLGAALVPISGMIFIIVGLISEMMKNVSLGLRLYGNIHGGHMAVEAMNKLGEAYYIPRWGRSCSRSSCSPVSCRR
ncbi:MAG: F0F1 ATP synthase subunit A [Fimbriimonadales bacterium]